MRESCVCFVPNFCRVSALIEPCVSVIVSRIFECAGLSRYSDLGQLLTPAPHTSQVGVNRDSCHNNNNIIYHMQHMKSDRFFQKNIKVN